MPTQLKEITPLFFSPLVSLQVTDSAALNLRLLEETKAMRTSAPGVNVSNQ